MIFVFSLRPDELTFLLTLDWTLINPKWLTIINFVFIGDNVRQSSLSCFMENSNNRGYRNVPGNVNVNFDIRESQAFFKQSICVHKKEIQYFVGIDMF